MTQKITFIIAPKGCAFHHVGPICQAIGAKHWTEVSSLVKPEDLPRVIQDFGGHHAVFVNNSREELEPHFPDSQILAYYHACRFAGVSPFHTGNGQVIGPLSHQAKMMPDITQEQVKMAPHLFAVLNEITRERGKQVGKGYDASSDDRYSGYQLIDASIAYSWAALGHAQYGNRYWPWDAESFKPEGQRANLIKAAALLVAEIERMDRLSATVKAGVQEMVKRGRCDKAPAGYQCTRLAGHDGPCAAVDMNSCGEN